MYSIHLRRILLTFVFVASIIGCSAYDSVEEIAGPLPPLLDFWGGDLINGEYVLGLALTPNDTMFASLSVMDTFIVKTSTDLGDTWRDTQIPYFKNPLLPGLNPFPLLLYKAESADVLYAQYDHVIRKMARSLDGGETWEEIRVDAEIGAFVRAASGAYVVGFTKTHGGGGISVFNDDFSSRIPSNLMYPVSVRTIIRLQYGAILAGTHNAGLWLSKNGGTVFNTIDLNFETGRILTLAEDRSLGHIYVGADNGLYKSKDGGKNWHKTGLDSTMYVPQQVLVIGADTLTALVHNRETFDSGDDIYFRRDMRVILSADGGTSWREILGLPTMEIRSIHYTKRGYLFAATRDGLFRSRNALRTF